MARSQILRATLAAAFIAGSVAVTALVAATPRSGAAADPFVAGQQAVDVATLSGPAAAAGIARADATRTQLGLPLPARQVVSHVVDRFAGTTYDEVTAFDGVGRMTALQQFDTAGRLTAAVRFGLTGDGGPPLADAAAATTACGRARRSGARRPAGRRRRGRPERLRRWLDGRLDAIGGRDPRAG